MKNHFILLLILICSVKIYSQNDTIPKPKKIEPKKQTEYVSIISLIANPEKYNGKRIGISGYMSAEFEGTAIYLSREDFDNRINKNSIFLLIGKGENYQIYHKEYVSLEGTFIIGGGHMGLYSGMIKDVEYVRKRN